MNLGLELKEPNSGTKGFLRGLLELVVAGQSVVRSRRMLAELGDLGKEILGGGHEH